MADGRVRMLPEQDSSIGFAPRFFQWSNHHRSDGGFVHPKTPLWAAPRKGCTLPYRHPNPVSRHDSTSANDSAWIFDRVPDDLTIISPGKETGSDAVDAGAYSAKLFGWE